MALLESGKLDANQRLLCRRPLRIGGVRMDCAHPASVLDLNAEEAIAYSCNSYFAEAATRLSSRELLQALRRGGGCLPRRGGGEGWSGGLEKPPDPNISPQVPLGDT